MAGISSIADGNCDFHHVNLSLVRPGRHIPGGHFVRLATWARQPNIQDIQPLWPKLDVKQMRQDGRSQKFVPWHDRFECRHVLAGGVDDKIVSQCDAKFGYNKLQSNLVPLARGVNLLSVLLTRETYIFAPLVQLLGYPISDIPVPQYSAHAALCRLEYLFDAWTQQR